MRGRSERKWRRTPTPGRARVHVAVALIALLLAPLLAAVAGPASPAAAVEPASTAVPPGLWDVAPPDGTTGDYVVMEGAEGDEVSLGADLVALPPRIDVVYDTSYGEPIEVLQVFARTGSPAENGRAVLLETRLPGPSKITEAGFHPDITSSSSDPTKTFLEAAYFDPHGHSCRYGVSTGWLAIDHIRVVDGKVGELDMRLEQSCNAGPAMHVKVHVDQVDESVSGPDPVPAGLWDAAPTGTGGQDYVLVEGAEGDPQTGGADSLYVGDAFDVWDYYTDLAFLLHSEGWVGSWSNHSGRGVVEPGFYPVDFDRQAPASMHPPFLAWQKVGVAECQSVAGWFAIDRIVRSEGVVVALDLRMEQSCDGNAPVHVKIHLDRSPPQLSRPPGPPFGSLDAARAVVGGVDVGGWAIDPDTAAPIDVHLYVDGKGTALTANELRSDVEAAFAGYGAPHGFNASIATSPGSHQVCAYGINVGVGGNTLLGCRTVTVLSGSPTGSLDVARQGPSSVVVGGWALDFDTTGSIPVHVYVDGKGTALTANGSRPDVGSLYPGYGSAHGFSATIPTTPGTHQVCAHGINSGAGGNTLLGCRTVTVPSGSPIGTIDVARGGPGWVSVGGWALDADTGDPIQVHVYVDTKGTAITASGSRPDVGAYFFGWGDAHGYATTVSATPGVHSVCVYGINVGSGGNTLFGCRNVTVS